MELAGNIVQSMGKFLNIEDLQTTGDFPQELEVLQKVFSEVNLFHYDRSDEHEYYDLFRLKNIN